MEERKTRPRPRKSRRKVCAFCVDKLTHIDYKDTARLRKPPGPALSLCRWWKAAMWTAAPPTASR